MKARALKLTAWLAVGMMVVAHSVLVYKARERLLHGYSDFSSFYSAATIVRDGGGQHLYESEKQWAVQKKLFPYVPVRKGPLLFNHPPFEALIYLPLAYLPYPRAFLCWAAINILFLVGFSWVMLLYALAFADLKQQNNFRAGCWLALAMFKFQLVIPFLPVLFVIGRRKALVGFGVSSLGVFFASALVTGWTGLEQYIKFLWKFDQKLAPEIAAIYVANMPNLRGLLSATLADRMTHPAVILPILMFSGLLLYFAVRVWRGFQGGEQGFNIRFCIALMITILVSYHFYIHDLSILALPLVLVVNHLAKSKDRWSARRYGLLLITGFLSVSPMYVFLLGKSQLNVLAAGLLLFLPLLGAEIGYFRRNVLALGAEEPQRAAL